LLVAGCSSLVHYSIARGQAGLHYRVAFTKSGTYRFACTVHTLAGMAGVITVAE